MQRTYTPYLLLVPVFAVIVAVVFIPLAVTFVYSFHTYLLTDPSTQMNFVGLQNYARVFNDPRFISSIATTLLYIGGSVAGMLVLGLTTAQVAHHSFRGQAIFRAAILLPWAVAPVVAAQAWKFMLETDYGIVNHLLTQLGLVESNIPWLVSRRYAMIGLVVTNVWKTTPLLALIVLSGLQSIEHDLYESAEIDGANVVMQYWYITLPLIRPFIFLGLIFTTLQTVNIIDIVYVMTGGGPGEATEILTLYNYRVFFKYLDFGQGGAMAVVGVTVIGLLISFYIRGVKRHLDA